MKNTIELQFCLEYSAKLMNICGSLQDKGIEEEALMIYKVLSDMHQNLITPLFCE